MKKDFTKQIADVIEVHKKMIADMEINGIAAIHAASEMIIKAIRRGGRLYICGNGGSAADAQHIAAEFVGRFRRERKALPAVALTTDTSAITSLGNDYCFEKVFSRQVEALVNKSDVLWAISTSGNSANVIAAVKTAKEKGAKILAFTGIRNSKLSQMADVCFCAGNESTARSQELHQLAYHIICDIVEQSFTQE